MGFGDFDRECLRVCLEVLQTYDPRVEEPSMQFKGTTLLFYELRLVVFFECMVWTLQGIIAGSMLNNMSVSVKHIPEFKSEALV